MTPSLLLLACGRSDAVVSPPPAAEEAAPAMETVKTGDAWVDALGPLGIPVTAAEDRAAARKAAAAELAMLQYAAAAALVSGGDSAETRAAFAALGERERAVQAEESRFVAEVLGGLDATTIAALRSEGGLEAAVLTPLQAEIAALGAAVRHMPLTTEAVPERVALLLLDVRYGLAAEGVAIDGAFAAVSLALLRVADAPGADALRDAWALLTDRMVRFQQAKFREALRLRSELSAREWIALLENWSMVNFLGCIGCVPDAGRAAFASDLLDVAPAPDTTGVAGPSGGADLGSAGGVMPVGEPDYQNR